MALATLIVTVLLALVAAASGIPKAAGMAKTTEEAAHLGIPRPRTAYRIIGSLEIAAAAALLAGLAWPALAAAAAGGLALLMLGAVLSHRRAGDPATAALPAMFVGGLAVAALALQLAVLRAHDLGEHWYRPWR